MKTSEFIIRVEDLGLRTETTHSNIEIWNSENYTEVAEVRHDDMFGIVTGLNFYGSLSSETRSKLFNLLVEYASTPLEEREEEKKYYIRHKHLSKNDNYLSFNIDDDIEDTDRWFFGDSCECEVDWYVTKFPLNALPSWAKELLEQGHLVKEEVE